MPKTYQAKIIELWNSKTGIPGILKVSKIIPFQPGQYYKANHSQLPSILPSTIFPIEINENGYLKIDNIPKTWQPGDIIQIWGPLGSGFSVPAMINSLGILSYENDPIRLLSLIALPGLQKVRVTLFCDELDTSLLSRLPVRVEILPLSAITDLKGELDFLAIEVELKHIKLLKESLLYPAKIWAELPGQVLVLTEMPCSGMGDCRVCAIKTKNGWKRACKDGPVFLVEDVLNVVE